MSVSGWKLLSLFIKIPDLIQLTENLLLRNHFTSNQTMLKWIFDEIKFKTVKIIEQWKLIYTQQ